LTRLVKAINKFVLANRKKRMAAFVVLLAENSPENQKKLKSLSARNGLAIPLGIALEGSKGPPAYKLSPDVPITVLVANRNRVRANFALTDPAPTDKKEQKKEIKQVLVAAYRMLRGR